MLPHDGGEQPHKKKTKQGAGNEGGKRIGTRSKEGDDVSEGEEDCQTEHGGGDPRDAIPHVQSGSCVNDKEMLSRPVWVMHNRVKANA
jgi:hypothetical protein